MKKLLSILTFVVTIILFSCSPSRNEMLDKISKMESEMKTASKVDTVAVSELISAYQNFASKYAADSSAPENLYKAASLAVGFNRGVQAVELYETLINQYPQFKKIPECYFMQAFAYENVIGNIVKANECYNRFLMKFPDHELADDAQAAIKFLGKTPEEMVHEFEKMNADSLGRK
ncbi:MAG: tetratricopeptide repeat protein [Bacteroidales bacterium]